MFTSPIFIGTFEDNKSFRLDGINDYLNFNTLNDNISALTAGAISIWIKVPSDDNTQRTFFSISNNASGVVTELTFLVDFREAVAGFPGNSLGLFAIENDVIQWLANSGANFINPHIGNWIHIVITHNGTTPILYVNGSPVSLVFETSTNKTSWFKSVLTDTSPIADTCTIGAIRRNGTILTPHNSNINELAVYNSLLSASEVTEIYNNRIAVDLEKLSSLSKLISWLRMGDDPLDDATSGTGLIKDQLGINDAVPFNTDGINIELDVA